MSSASPAPLTYHNPVFGGGCPDPFVLKFAGEYWCYFTGIQADGRAFGILHSTDLIVWQTVGSAMDLLPGGHTCYWAPEVIYHNGRFYLYYSVGNETFMHIRVAVSERPQGPFQDAGRRLTKEDFAIDAHLFTDEDGQRYLFYATDFLAGARLGTGTVVDRLLDLFTLAGAARPVTRARYDWQIYDPARLSKGGVRWHTIEGPFVLKHNGRYYQMFSAGNWQNKTYGVSYAVASSLQEPGEWEQHADGEKVLPVLRSLPDLGVIGPGHNSVVRGPDNRQLFCVYHRWQPETHERVLAIDRLDWSGDELVVHGPTVSPQPAPPPPDQAGFAGFTCLEGDCQIGPQGLQLTLSGPQAAASLPLRRPDFLLEVTFQPALPPSPPGELGFALFNAGSLLAQITLRQGQRVLAVKSAAGQAEWALPPGFDPLVPHLLRLEVHASAAGLSIDASAVRLELPLSAVPTSLRLFASSNGAIFRGLALS
jgi:GH43 family beta-xylosidase